jgi:hypothetical protein
MADNEPRISEVPTGLVVAVGRLDKRVVTEASAFVTSHAAGESGMGPNTGGRRAVPRRKSATAECPPCNMLHALSVCYSFQTRS